MKKIILISLILEAMIHSIIGQTDSTYESNSFRSGEFLKSDNNSIIKLDSSNDIKLTYGMEINHFTTNSGFKPGIEFSFFVKGSNGRRSLEVAAFFDNESKSIAGFSIHHKYMLLKNRSEINSKFKPYLFYNFIYRSTALNGPLTTKPEIAKVLGIEGKTTVVSIEHILGLGLKMDLINSMYLHCDVGYGRYLGSIKKPGTPDAKTGIYKGGDGWGMFSKLGVGIEF